MKNFLLFALSFVCLNQLSYAQYSKTVLSEDWNFDGGNLPVYYKTRTTTDSQSNIYITGATINAQNNKDLIIQKIDKYGSLVWQQVVNGSAGLDDGGTDIYIDNQQNVYVTGSVAQINTGNDLVVLKYSSTGTLIWSQYFDFNNNYEGGTALTKYGNYIYVTGTSLTSTSLYDYLTLSIKDSDGSVAWNNYYNYSDLNDVAVSLVINNSQVVVTGASEVAITPLEYEIATISYDLSTGNQIDEVRSSGSSISGVDRVYDITRDNNNNLFIAGSVINQSTGYDIALFKFDQDLNLLWQHYIDENNGDDEATSIQLDNSGNIYITGYISNANEGKNIFVKKLDANANELWSRELKGQANLDDIGTQIKLLNNSDIYITGSIRNINTSDFILAGFNSSGDLITSKIYDYHNQLDDSPTAMAIDADGNIIITGQCNTTGSNFETTTVKYTIYDRVIDYNYINNEPAYVANNIIIRFKKNSVITSTYQNKNKTAGKLSDFINQNTLDALAIKTGFNWESLTAYRIHTKFGPEDSLSVTRNGDTISTNDFWTALTIETPKGYSEDALCDSAKTIILYILDASPNTICITASIPNDSYYSNQYSLYPNLVYPNSDINVEGAWDYEVGSEEIKVSIVDCLVDYWHEDFGDGTYSGSKIKGYDCVNDQDLSLLTIPPNNNHGTKIAGIIGALRNNNIGVSGIAGGDMTASNSGVKLYSMVAFGYNGATSTTMDAIVQAMELGNMQTTANNGFGVHLQNLSFVSYYPNSELYSAIKNAHKNCCALIAARGNDGLSGNYQTYPACYVSDEMIINVIASGNDGNLKIATNGDNPNSAWGSSYGFTNTGNLIPHCENVDVMAPGVNEIIATTNCISAVQDTYNNCAITTDNNYSCFMGTSAAAPHVSGLAALILSKHRIINNYPNILIPEDIEAILERTSIDKNTLGFDYETAYGLINAQNALEKVSNPYYIKHVIASPTNIQLIGYELGGSNVTVATNQFGIPEGQYLNAQRYRCTWDVTETLPAGHNIIDYWNTTALDKIGIDGQYTYNYFQNQSFGLTNENLTVNIGSNTSHVYAETYTFKINSSNGSYYWFPYNPNELQYVYSLHVQKQENAGIEENNIYNLNLFPNPSQDFITVSFDNVTKKNATIEIIDAMGKSISKYENIYSYNETLSIENLENGVYFCKITIDNLSAVKTFIKTK